MINQLRKNNTYFEKMIKEKKEKRVALEIQMSKIRGSDPNRMSRNSLSQSASGSLSKTGSFDKNN